MATFSYRAKLSDGRIQAGLIQAGSKEEAKMALEERGMTAQVVEERLRAEAVSQGLVMWLNRVSEKELVIFARTLAVMVSASVTITDALRNISSQTKNPKFQSILLQVASEVEGGGKFSDALEKHTEIFSSFYVNMVRSGETSGQLAEVLDYLADQQEKDFDLTSKIKGAMIYPAFIIGTMVVVGFVMMTFVVPKLVGVLQEANVELPWTTKTLIAVSGFFANNWLLLLVAMIALAVGWNVGIRTPRGRYLWDYAKLRLPVIGKLSQEVAVVRFSRSLATLAKGGVDLVSALEIVAGVMDNEVWRRIILQTIHEVNDGNSLTTVMAREAIVPPMMIQMLSIGEGTGKTNEVLQRLASFFSRDIDNVVANLVHLIEPLVLIVLGLGVGVLVSAILLPMYQLSQSI